MPVLTANSLSKYFGAEEIFADIDVEIPDGAKVALVGPNGAGKTTLIRILIGHDTPTEGTVHRKRGLRIGLLPQHPILEGHHTLWDEMLNAFIELRAQERRLAELEHALADPSQADSQEELLERYGKLQHDFADAGGYTYEQEIKRVLLGLSFKLEDFNRPLSQLSGGQTTRALLGRLLLEAPDLLVLDEPTNHLDIAAVEWLESYLRGWQGALLMVSHDRYFMDRVVNIIWELDFGALEVYRGNYSHYTQQREERMERQLKEYEAQQEFIKKELDYIQRNIAGQNTRQAQGRRKRLERMMSGTDRHGRPSDHQWMIKRPRRRETMHLKLSSTRTGNEILRTYDLSIGYADAPRPLFSAPNILLLREETAAVIGPNGAGKSTFIKTILGQLAPLSGEFTWGAKVKLGYFSQGHEGLNPDNTILEELLLVKNIPISQSRNYLAQYLFREDDVHRQVKTLSGGERGRLALAKLSLDGANVLLLDEPSNHLDMPSQEILQDVLAQYTGTILLVSHDRYLIDALASQIWMIEDGQMTVFNGTYHEYIAHKESSELKAAEAAKAMNRQQKEKSKNGDKKSSLSSQEKKRLASLETEIADLEVLLESLTEQLEVASAAGDVDKVATLGHQYTETEATLHQKMEEWVKLA